MFVRWLSSFHDPPDDSAGVETAERAAWPPWSSPRPRLGGDLTARGSEEDAEEAQRVCLETDWRISVTVFAGGGRIRVKGWLPQGEGRWSGGLPGEERWHLSNRKPDRRQRLLAPVAVRHGVLLLRMWNLN